MERNRTASIEEAIPSHESTLTLAKSLAEISTAIDLPSEETGY
jgi:hypothetical protein